MAAALPPLTREPVDGLVVDAQSAWEGGVIVTTRVVLRDGELVEERRIGGAVGDIAQVASHPTTREPALLEGVGGATAFVRDTTQSSEKCMPPYQPLFWNRVTVPWLMDAAGSADVGAEATRVAVQASFDTWQAIDCAYVDFRADGPVPDAPVGYDQGGGKNVVKWIEADWPFKPEAQAITLTTFRCSTGEILDADIVVNGVNFTYTTTPGVGTAGDTDVQNTITHEVGHLVGFAHSPEPDSTMFATAASGETLKRDLTPDDVAGVCEVYKIGQEPTYGNVVVGGCAVGQDAGGGGGVIVAVALLVALRRRRV